MRWIFLIFFTLSTLNSFTQDTATIEFAQVFYNNAWRIIDRQGKFILNLETGAGPYENLCFGDKLAISYKNKKYGFINFSNKQVIPNKFDGVHCFVYGYAPAAIGNKWGIINKTGKFVVQPIYDYVGIFDDQKLAPVIKDNKIGFVDTTGKLVVPFKYYWTRSLSTFPDYPILLHGLICIVEADDPDKLDERKMGCINSRGEMVIPAVYEYISWFFDGVATAKKDGKILLIDTLGNIVLEPKGVDYGSLYFENGYSVFHKPGVGSGMIKRNGEIILEAKYNGVNAFAQGYAAVQISADEKGVKSGFIDTTGRFVFDRTFGQIKSFREGYAAVEIDNKWGFIDRTGKTVIAPKYFVVMDFNEGLAAVGVKSNGQIRYGYIDTTGKFVLPPIYNDANYFEYGLAPVKIGNNFGFIDKTGKVVIAPKFKNAFGFQRETLGWY